MRKIILLIFLIFPYGGIAFTLLGDYFDKRKEKEPIMDFIGVLFPILILINPILIRAILGLNNTIANYDINGWTLLFISTSLLCLLSGMYNHINCNSRNGEGK